MQDQPVTPNEMNGTELPPPSGRPSLRRSGERTTRRRALAWLIGVSSAAFGVAFALPGIALRTLRAEVKTVDAGDVLVYATGDQAGTAIDVTDIPPGAALQAFPEGKTEESRNLIELVRLAEEPSSVVAYSAICTHLGCSVLAELTDEGLIPCPCHASFFNPAKDAAVVAGPAGRPLPSLPIEIRDDGTIVATSGFIGDVGPD